MSSTEVNNLQHIDRECAVNEDFWNGEIARNFGDITLVAVFKPAYTDLVISTEVWQTIDENQSFVFQIAGTAYDTAVTFQTMTVVIQGSGSITIEKLPVGEYTVTELTGWSWRYEVTSSQDTTVKAGAASEAITIKLENPDKDYGVKFTNNREIPFWLNGYSYKKGG
jgi:hypothetical protein